MNRIYLVVLIFFIFNDGQAQNLTAGYSDAKPCERIPYGLTAEHWTKVQKIWSRNNYPVKIILSDSTEVIGQMLWANDSALVYWADPHSLINPFQADSLLKSIELSQVSHVLVNRYFEFKLFESGLLWGPLAGAAYGLLVTALAGELVLITIPMGIGTFLGGLWEAVSMSINNSRSDRKTFFDYYSLPEKIGNNYFFFPDSTKGNYYVPASTALLTTDLEKASFNDLMRLSHQAGRAFATPRFSVEMLFARFKVDPDESMFNFSAGYMVSEKYRIGYSFRKDGNSSYGTETGSGYELYEYKLKTSHHICFNYFPGSLNWLLTTPFFKASAGADVSLNEIDYSNTRSSGTYYASQRVHKYLPGFGLMAGFDFYFLRNLSVGINAVQTFSKPIQAGEQTVIDPMTKKEVTLEGVTVRTSGFRLYFGLGFHF